MQSQKRIDDYRRMTPAERLQLTFELIEQGAPYLNYGSPDQVLRKYQRIREQNDLANRRILDALARTRDTATKSYSHANDVKMSGSSDSVQSQVVAKEADC